MENKLAKEILSPNNKRAISPQARAEILDLIKHQEHRIWEQSEAAEHNFKEWQRSSAEIKKSNDELRTKLAKHESDDKRKRELYIATATTNNELLEKMTESENEVTRLRVELKKSKKRKNK